MADDTRKRMKINVREILQRYFLAGLLVFLPVVITLWFLGWVIGLMDGLLDVLPSRLHPNSYLPFAIPGLGAVFTIALILFLGVLTRGVATRRFLAAWDKVFVQIPIFAGCLHRRAEIGSDLPRPIADQQTGRDDRISAEGNLCGGFRHGARLA